MFNTFFNKISAEEENVSILYESSLHENNFDALMRENEKNDIKAQYTLAGIHKDDYSFLMNTYQVKKFCSQGQQKTFLISLKLAHYEYLKNIKHAKPMLLLDDVFDKLDDTRVEKLTVMVAHKDFGQVFITPTQKISHGRIIAKCRHSISFTRYNVRIKAF